MSEEESESQNKKYSKISSALKCQLFKFVYLDKLSIKNSAKLCNLNYSTAKSALKGMTQKQQNFISNELHIRKITRKTKKTKSKNSLYVSKIVDIMLNRKQISDRQDLKEQEDEAIALKSQNIKPISIVSSIGFDFFNTNEIKIDNKDLSTFNCPFLNRKGFSCVLDLKKIADQGYLIPKECPFRVFCKKMMEEPMLQDEKFTQKVKN